MAWKVRWSTLIDFRSLALPLRGVAYAPCQLHTLTLCWPWSLWSMPVSPRRACGYLSGCWGRHLSCPRDFPLHPIVIYLGTSAHVGDVATVGVVTIQSKIMTTAKVLEHLDLAAETKQLPADTAGKLRGDLNWYFSMESGRIGKLAGPMLTARQRTQHPELTRHEVQTILFSARGCTGRRASHNISFPGIAEMVRIYSDAPLQNGVLRLGWVVVDACLPRPQGRTAEID